MTVTPNSCDFIPATARLNPSAVKPRFRSSRTAEALLGILLANRQSSRALSSSGVSMICRRSPLVSSDIAMLHSAKCHKYCISSLGVNYSFHP